MLEEQESINFPSISVQFVCSIFLRKSIFLLPASQVSVDLGDFGGAGEVVDRSMSVDISDCGNIDPVAVEDDDRIFYPPPLDATNYNVFEPLVCHFLNFLVLLL